ncbi:MAG: CheR family methyltransferase, partial [Acidimicrobiales bacterium]
MAQPTPDDAELEALLSYIFEHRSFDFRGYKRASLTRRIQRRMHAVGAEGYRVYIEMLEANPGEFSQLFDSILINVTSFLRDKDAWDVLEEIVVRPLAAASPEHHHVRVWSAGSASGEEAYSLAVLLADALGRTRFRSTVKIYATDVDTDALTRARAGRYAREHVVEAFGEERAGRFFELEGDVATFDLELRRALIFGRHDLVQDPPISKIDLLVCRNTLMYFTSEAQREILGNLHFALNPTGVLFLGKSEALVTRMDIFEPLDARQRIVRKRIERPSTATPVIRNSGRSASQ